MKRIIGIVLACLLLIGVFVGGTCLGYYGRTTPKANQAEQNLMISVTNDWKGGFTTIPLEQGKFSHISWLNLDNVTIEIDGVPMKLEEAIQKGYTSVDQMIADARKDADLGICNEVAKSKNGLAEFFYFYPEFNLHYVYDIYETPDGRKHLIADFLIYGTGSEPSFAYTWDENGEPIDYEDWGLRFAISKASSSGISISCSQAGGQQLGELSIRTSWLEKRNPNTSESELIDTLGEDDDPVPTSKLVMEGTTELSVDFSALYGDLPAGDYVLALEIIDSYDKEKVPSLMRKYHDSQWYYLEFTIG